MTIEIINKDVTTVTTGVIAHGVNCQGVMGSGVAKAIRAKWPAVFDRYKLICDAVEDKKELLGLAHCVNVGEAKTYELFVANCFTQVNYGKDGKKYADLVAVQSSLRYALGFAVGAKLPLYLPRIGCGLGGLDWDTEVGPALQEIHDQFNVNVFGTFSPVVYVCDWS